MIPSKTDRRSKASMLLTSLGALFALALDAAAAPKPSTPPNVVLIMADDLGIGDVGCYGGCYGSKVIATPNIDRLASQGIRALDAHAAAAVCTPSRYAMMTGRYYYQNWVGELLVDTHRPTIASVLHDHGYATGYFGKWHLGWGVVRPDRKNRQDIDWNSELRPGVLECGFDTFYGTPFTHNEPPAVFVHDRNVVGLEPSDPLKIEYPNGGIDMEKGAFAFGRSTGAAMAHLMRPDDRIDLIVTEKAIEWIRQTKEKPFFLNLALAAPHAPIDPAKEFLGRTGEGVYADFVYELDWCVGRILRALDDCGVADNTMVIFLSDNGAVIYKEVLARGHRANLNWLGQKTDAWEGGVREPFIVRWPGKISPGTTTGALISLADVVKTVWATAGIKAPEGEAKDSLDQLPVLLSPTAQPIRSEMLSLGIYGFALRSGDWVFIPGQGSRGVTTDLSAHWGLHLNDIGESNSDYDDQGRLKEGAPKQQLYNLRDDPGQTRNVIRDFPEKAAELEKRYNELLKTL